jgi:hypothetical protein
VARVLHSEQVAAALSALPTPARSAVEERLEYVQSMPRMYGLTEDERFPGCLTFWGPFRGEAGRGVPPRRTSNQFS